MIKRRTLALGTALLTGVHMGCGTRSPEADIEALNSLQKQVDSAIIAGDTERYVSLITADAVLMPPNGSPVIGRDAIRLWNEAMSRQVRIQQYRSTDDEIVVAGDWAFRRASVDWTLAPTTGGEPIHDLGKYVIIYRRQEDGSWRVARDIWNSNTPPR